MTEQEMLEDPAPVEREWRRTLLVAIVATLVFVAGIPWATPSLKTVCGADRILAGEVPYRDFWTMYAPGSCYAVAAVFEWLGRELWIQALATTLVLGVGAAIFFRVLRAQGTSGRLGLVITAIIFFLFWHHAPELWSYPTALFCVLLALLCFMPYLRGTRRRGLFLAGLCLGAAACFKHDVAGYVALSFTAAIWLSWLLTRSEERPETWLRPMRATLWLASGALFVALPVIVLLARHAGVDAWQDIIVFPATDFPLIRSDEYPPWIPELAPLRNWLENPSFQRGIGVGMGLVMWAVLILPHAFFWTGVVAVVLFGRRWNPATRSAAILWLVLIPPFWFAAHVQQNTHPWTMAIACFSLWALAWVGVGGGWRGGAVRALLLVALLPFAAAHLFRPALQVFGVVKNVSTSKSLDLPGGAFLRPQQGEVELLHKVVGFVRDNVPPDEPIHVGVPRHDAVVISDRRIYYFADRPCATRYHELHPAINDREDVQREMIADLETKNVRCVVIWKFAWKDHTLDRIKEKRMSLVPGTGSELLDDYIRDNYELVRDFGKYDVLWRKGAVRPWES